MKLLAIGDVCGSIGCEAVGKILPSLKKTKKIHTFSMTSSMTRSPGRKTGNSILSSQTNCQRSLLFFVRTTLPTRRAAKAIVCSIWATPVSP